MEKKKNRLQEVWQNFGNLISIKDSALRFRTVPYDDGGDLGNPTT